MVISLCRLEPELKPVLSWAVSVPCPVSPRMLPSATFRLFVWDNSSGLFESPDKAFAAWSAGYGLAVGISKTFTVNGIGGDLNSAPYLVGLESFNVVVIPEPGSAALLSLAGGLLLFRRRLTPS